MYNLVYNHESGFNYQIVKADIQNKKRGIQIGQSDIVSRV